MMISKCLAFDPGLARIGWSLLEKNNSLILDLNILETGKIKHNNNEIKATKEIHNLIKKHNPTVVAYEKTGTFLNKIYSEIIENATRDFKIPAIGFKVTDIRSFLYLDANISKQESHYILKEHIFNLPKNISRDELDAISVAFVALNIEVVTKGQTHA